MHKIYISESERSSTLDTLPEGKQVYSGSQSTYRRVYPDWKPSTTIEKTDVVGAMEMVEEVQPQLKDKSAWRKSNLNVANSTEEAKGVGSRLRHTIPRIIHNQDSNSLSDTKDDNRDRKELISSLADRPPTDKLILYIRPPNEPLTPERNSNLGFIPRRVRESQQSIDSEISNNKVEIDQDNIETPPTTRRVFTPTPVDKREPSAPTRCSRLTNKTNRENAITPDEPDPSSSLGDGQFDRFSATRRTRRYKRNTESNETAASPELVAETQIIKPSILQVETSSPVQKMEIEVDKETRLKTWQDRLKTSSDSMVESKFSNRRNRNQTGINEEDVQKVLNLTHSAPIDIQTTTEKRRVSYINTEEPKTEINKVEIPIKKIKEHDNDEGFEETQSLMSESPSQGASSGGQYETDHIDSSQGEVSDFNKTKQHSLNAERKETSNLSKQNSAINTNKAVSRLTKPVSNGRTTALVQKFSKSFERTNPIRHTTQEVHKKSVIPRRSDSLKKSDSQSSVLSKKVNVIQKSNSRNSLVSSRSSLNSNTSTNTVKRIPLKVANNNVNKNVVRTPSIKTLNSNNKSSTVRRTPSTNNTTNQKPPRPQGSSFMKPTTASATKSNSASSIANRLHSAPFRSKN